MFAKISDPRFTRQRELYIPMIWLWIPSFGMIFVLAHLIDLVFMIYFKTSFMPVGFSFCYIHWHCLYSHVYSFAIESSNIYRNRDFNWNRCCFDMAFSCTSREQKYQTKTPCSLYHSTKYEKSGTVEIYKLECNF